MLNKTKLLILLGTAAVVLTTGVLLNSNKDKVDLGKSNTVVEFSTNQVELLAQGSFSGRSDHITTGQVSLQKTPIGYQLTFAANFSLDGAPDPIVALGNSETYLPINKIGALKNKAGQQTYQLPASFTPGQFSEVYVWCEQFSVPLGIAQLASK